MSSLRKFLLISATSALVFTIIGSIAAAEQGAAAGFVIAIGFIIYLLPSLIAYSRKCPSRHSILALNFFLSWTIVGWVASLVWALRNFEYTAPVKIVQSMNESDK